MLIRYEMWRYDLFLQSDRISGDGEIEWRPTGLTTPTSRWTNPQLVKDRVDAECDRVADREREKISPALRYRPAFRVAVPHSYQLRGKAADA